MRWLRTYLDGKHDSLPGGRDRSPNEHDGGYGPQGHGDSSGRNSHDGSGRESIGGGDEHGGFSGRGHVWHADATVPAADTSRHSGHGGRLSFVNHSHDSATVYSGHHSDGVGAATAFGGAGGSGAVTLQGNGNGIFLEVNAASHGTNMLIAGNGAETLVAGSATHANTFELGLPSTGGHGAPVANAVASTGGSGLQTFLLGSSSSSTLTGSNAAGATNLYEFIRDSATEANGAAHFTITDFNAANSTLFITDSTTAAGNVGIHSITKAIGGGAEITLSDGSTITLKGVDPQSLVAHSGAHGSISIV
ncbi:MAG TPA: hypothetical protein VNC39_13260 [Acidocella sp.]|uniref:hypothetical protein n=1 Tax=Acidocella sp. TaxID=50710 RepID=UPI002D01A8FA|nr:hypothetical protein [Acidocella sp.]HVE22937.1 hypothetical protein [Acidocella sp.]